MTNHKHWFTQKKSIDSNVEIDLNLDSNASLNSTESMTRTNLKIRENNIKSTLSLKPKHIPKKRSQKSMTGQDLKKM